MIKEKIANIIAGEEAALSMGSAEDWGDYRLRVGRIAGLVIAAEVCDEVRKLIIGDQS